MTSFGLMLAVAVAGALGAVTRYLVVEAVARRWQGRFPLATFLINTTGAFALALLLTVAAGNLPLAAPLRSVLGTGFLGGYTTFSTLSFETHALVRRGELLHARLNVLGTLVAGVLAVAVGVAIGRAIA